MGWGICFDLDANNVLFCTDGCKWKAPKSEMPTKISACRYILDYFENDLHRELDMIRDECPGTAAALAAACEEEFPGAVNAYYSLPDETKKKMSEETLNELREKLAALDSEFKNVKDRLNTATKEFKQYKRPQKKSKYRFQDIEQDMILLKLEYNYEKAAHDFKQISSEMRKLKKHIKCEESY
jgi:hypothetical protein